MPGNNRLLLQTGLLLQPHLQAPLGLLLLAARPVCLVVCLAVQVPQMQWMPWRWAGGLPLSQGALSLALRVMRGLLQPLSLLRLLVFPSR